MPAYETHEAHHIVVDAAPDAVYRAALELTAGEIRLLRPLMFLRMLPARLAGRSLAWDDSSPAIDVFVRSGFTLLGERQGREIALGAVGRFWSMTRNQPVTGIDTADQFAAFAEPGYAKAALNLLVLPEDTRTRLVTETRVVCTSTDATRSFSRYWFAIRWGSGAIRRSWLAAVKRRAMSASVVMPGGAT